MAGVIGGGGLGDLAIPVWLSSDSAAMSWQWRSVAIVVLVELIQFCGHGARKTGSGRAGEARFGALKRGPAVGPTISQLILAHTEPPV